MTGGRLPSIAVVAPLEHHETDAEQAQWFAGQLESDGYEVRRVATDPVFPPGFGWLEHAWLVGPAASEALYVARLPSLRQADVVHIYAPGYSAFVRAAVPAVLMARRLRKPVLLNYLSADVFAHLAEERSLIHAWLKRADEIVVPSPNLQSLFARHGYGARMIPKCVDAERFHYRPRVRLRPHVLSVRPLEAQYGVEQAIIASALLATAFPDTRLTVAGTGSQERELRQLSRALGVRHVQFLGRVEASAMPALYDGADIYLNASYHDDQPQSLLEAMAAGMPIVTTGVGDIPRLLAHGAHGTLVDAGDAAAMAKAVTALVEQPERALLMAQRARQALGPYTWTHARSLWGGVYDDLLHRSRRRAA